MVVSASSLSLVQVKQPVVLRRARTLLFCFILGGWVGEFCGWRESSMCLVFGVDEPIVCLFDWVGGWMDCIRTLGAWCEKPPREKEWWRRGQ